MKNEKLSKYIEIVGKGNYLLIDSERFPDYLHDETYLIGSAEIVLFATSHEQVKQIVNLSLQFTKEDNENKDDYKITVRGLGSGLAGGAVPYPQEDNYSTNRNGGIVLSLEKLDNFYELDTDNMRFHVDAGCITSNIHSFLRAKNLTYLPDPSSSNISTIGGNIATNAAGPKSFKYGSTRNYISKILVVWGDGTDDWIGAYTNKSSVGFSLKDLLIASEGRLGIITEVVLKINVRANFSATVLVGVESYEKASQMIIDIKQSNLDISAIEFIDERSIESAKNNWPQNMQDKKALLLMELEGEEENVFATIEKLEKFLSDEEVILATDEKRIRSIWDARKKVSENVKKQKKIKIGEDVSIPVNMLSKSIDYFYRLGNKYQIDTVIWGHAGDGNLHVNMLLDVEADIKNTKKMLDEMVAFVLSIKGSISGEHGLGIIKKKYIVDEQGSNLVEKQEQLAKIFDPYQILNPHLVKV